MKYMGSKSRIAKYIVPILQECIDSNHVTTYIEPFVGGGNVIDKIRCQERIGSDINPYLIALLKRVQEGKPLLDEVSRDTYLNTSSYLTYDRISFRTGTITIYKDSLITNNFKGVYDEILIDELVEDSKWEMLAEHTNRHGSYKEKYKSKEELSFA